MTDTLNSRASAEDLATDVLGALFRPPSEIVGNAEWVRLFEMQVAQLRRDAAGLPLDMAQSQLIERTATTYIRLKWYETNGGLSSAQLTALNELYLKFVAQFQKILQTSDEQLRQDLLLKSMDICERAVDQFEDQSVRHTLRQHFKTEFAALGW